MASVSSLDQDMRNLRMSRYTSEAVKEVRTWIEETLGHSISPGDLLEALKDGVALCELANLALPSPGFKYKKTAMPFIQMENISHFLKACEMPPLSMPAHDRFLTVDLYESKDPAQVLQCLGAFSRQAHAANPSRFRTMIGPKRSSVLSPTNTGGANGASWRQPYGAAYNRAPSPTKASAGMPSATRAMSPALTGGSTGSQSSAKSHGPVSSWSQRKDEGTTAPAWNIHQYGYMGGASQGNQGISFGARRQITSHVPNVPSLAEKERARKQKAEESERLRHQAEEAEHRRLTEREAEEERDRVAEERRWEEETRCVREEERRRVEEQKRQWEDQERKWQLEEEIRRSEQSELQSLMPKKQPERPRVSSSSILRGQSLAQYQREQAAVSAADKDDRQHETSEQRRVRELELQLEEARERERQYQQEREERLRAEKQGRPRPGTGSTMATSSRPQTAQSNDVSEVSWTGDERDFLRKQHPNHQNSQSVTPAKASQRHPGASTAPPKHDGAEDEDTRSALPSRDLPQPTAVDRANDEDPDLPPSLAPRRVPQHESLLEPLDRDLPSLRRRPQQADSASSLPQHSPDSASRSSPLGSPSRPRPTPQHERSYEAYSPEQRRPSRLNTIASNPIGGSFLPQRQPSRTDQFLATTAAPQHDRPRISSSAEAGDTSREQQSDRDRRLASQTATKQGAWAGKSLLEREMEKERERQREWEEAQQALKSASRDTTQGMVSGQSWDVNQYGYTGGDNLNRGSSAGSGIAMGGRRQIVGPRPQGPR